MRYLLFAIVLVLLSFESFFIATVTDLNIIYYISIALLIAGVLYAIVGYTNFNKTTQK